MSEDEKAQYDSTVLALIAQAVEMGAHRHDEDVENYFTELTPAARPIGEAMFASEKSAEAERLMSWARSMRRVRQVAS